jgi:hypothetical protein
VTGVKVIVTDCGTGEIGLAETTKTAGPTVVLDGPGKAVSVCPSRVSNAGSRFKTTGCGTGDRAIAGSANPPDASDIVIA